MSATGTTGIGSPTNDLSNHTKILRQLKETTEVGQGLRGNSNNQYVQVGMLLATGLFKFVNGALVPVTQTTSSGGGSTVATAESIQGTGAAGSPIQLVNDAATPGNSKVYGTSSSGVKGWYAASSGGGGSSSPYNVTPDTHSAIPTGVGLGPNDEFEYGTSLDTAGARYSGATPWVYPTVNAYGLVAAVANGRMIFSSTTGGGSVNNNTGITLPLSASSYTIETKLIANSSGAYSGVWVGLAATGEGLYLGLYQGSAYLIYQTSWSGSGIIDYGNIGGWTTWPSNPAGPLVIYNLYLRITFNGSNYLGQISLDYESWETPTGGAAVTPPFSAAPDSIGLYSSMNAIGAPICMFEYIRRLA